MSCEWDNHESTDIMKSHRWSYSVGEIRRRFIWLSLKFERADQSISNGFTLSYEMMRYWDWLCAWLCGFKVSSMTYACLWVLISIHEFCGNRVECLSMWFSRNLIRIMWMRNVTETWWLCANYENLMNYVCF